MISRWFFVLWLPVFVFLSTNCESAERFHITDIKTAYDIDAQFMPIRLAKKFPPDSAKVACWFKWSGGQTGAKIAVKWTYLTGDIAILTTDFLIPRKKGSGGVTLSMPAGKTLPPGLYEARFVLGGKSLKSVRFEVLEK